MASDRGGVGHVNDVGGVLTALDAQGHPQVRVGQDVVVDHARGPLGGQHHVDPQGAFYGGHAHQGGEHVRVLLGEHRELVDHQQQARHGLGGAGGQVGVQVVHAVARGREEPLAVGHLGLQGAQGPVGHLGVEVGDGADRVGQALTGLERRPALEVNEDEGQARGVVACGQPGHQGAEELALARPRGPAHQAMGAVTYDVELHDTPLPHADGGGDPRAAPQAPHLGGGDLLQPQEGAEPDQAGQGGAGDLQLRILQAGQGAGGLLRLRHAGPAQGHVLHPLTPLGVLQDPGGVLADLDDGGAGGGQVLAHGRDHDAADPPRHVVT